MHFQYLGRSGRKRGNKMHNFLSLTLKCYVDIMAPAWVVDSPAGQGPLWSAEWLHVPHEKLGGCCQVPKDMPPIGVLIPRAHSAASFRFVASLLTSLATAQTFTLGLQRQMHALGKKKNHKYKYLPEKSTFKHLPN